MEISEININDADSFLKLNKKLDSETKFLLMEPNERKTSIEEQKVSLKERNTA